MQSTSNIPKEILEFLDCELNNRWLSIGNMEIYVRKSNRHDPRYRSKHNCWRKCLDIANVSCGQKGCGEFTALLSSLKGLTEYGFEAIFIEQVISNRFADYFRRLNCIEVNQIGAIPSFFLFIGE